ncbi:MAG: ABC transporter permease [Chloroflexota bacterium]|nr:ABC transporter permease [Chloroflexota bacterium]
MKQQLRPLFWVEAVLALLNAGLLVMTVVWTDWIELAFNLDPDAGSGAVEWAVVGGTLVLTLAFVALARTEWRRSSMQTA